MLLRYLGVSPPKWRAKCNDNVVRALVMAVNSFPFSDLRAFMPASNVRAWRVLKARRNVPARRLVGTLRGFAVIEMAAQELDRSETVVGDRLMVKS